MVPLLGFIFLFLVHWVVGSCLVLCFVLGLLVFPLSTLCGWLVCPLLCLPPHGSVRQKSEHAELWQTQRYRSTSPISPLQMYCGRFRVAGSVRLLFIAPFTSLEGRSSHSQTSTDTKSRLRVAFRVLVQCLNFFLNNFHLSTYKLERLTLRVEFSRVLTER